ncbi:MutS-related protein [Pedobacter faecalis]|uniref:MutS-related protein n=1 Tax=Pedobacter faecalis TaxID=3041495 RepID=UPI00254A5323|nr:DNA mismatch repair protein [Pedobacter sp. ELA7]
MSFIADKQTLNDLNLAGRFTPNSIFSLFNKTKTTGGERLLQEMFKTPLTNPEDINQRSSIIQFFQQAGLTFPLDGPIFDAAGNHMALGTSPNRTSGLINLMLKKASAALLRDDKFQRMVDGLSATVEVLNKLRDFWEKLGQQIDSSPYNNTWELFGPIFSDARLASLIRENEVAGWPLVKLARYDHLMRHVLRKEIELLFDEVCRLDVYIAVAQVSHAKGFSFAEALPKEKNEYRSSALRHPMLEKAVANPLSFKESSNLLFLTGANMAGKSTLMKAFGISVYLAHMGFPVAAEDMVFSVKDGIYSSVNVPDNIQLGLSHFYAEVLRVKHVAQEVASGKNLVVIFDELFKGTNVKDAYDGTLAVTQAFARYTRCCFLVSTHIVEVGEALSAQTAGVQFAYLPTVMAGSKPTYTYRLEQGISSDRQGMLIIQNEGILELLEEK